MTRAFGCDTEVAFFEGETWVTHITNDIPGGLSRLDRNGIDGEEVAFLDCFLKTLFIQFLNNNKKILLVSSRL